MGPRCIKAAQDMIYEYLEAYSKEIGEAYQAADNALDVTLKARFSHAGNQTAVKVSISFVRDKCTDNNEVLIDENQRPLFKAVEDNRTISDLKKGLANA